MAPRLRRPATLIGGQADREGDEACRAHHDATEARCDVIHGHRALHAMVAKFEADIARSEREEEKYEKLMRDADVFEEGTLCRNRVPITSLRPGARDGRDKVGTATGPPPEPPIVR